MLAKPCLKSSKEKGGREGRGTDDLRNSIFSVSRRTGGREGGREGGRKEGKKLYKVKANKQIKIMQVKNKETLTHK